MWFTHTHILYVNDFDHFWNQISRYSEPLLCRKAISSGWPENATSSQKLKLKDTKSRWFWHFRLRTMASCNLCFLYRAAQSAAACQDWQGFHKAPEAPDVLTIHAARMFLTDFGGFMKHGPPTMLPDKSGETQLKAVTYVTTVTLQYDKPTTKWWWNCCPIFSSFTVANDLSGMLSTGEDTQVVMQTVRVSANGILHATKIIGQRTWKFRKNTCIIPLEWK